MHQIKQAMINVALGRGGDHPPHLVPELVAQIGEGDVVVHLVNETVEGRVHWRGVIYFTECGPHSVYANTIDNYEAARQQLIADCQLAAAYYANH